ncbi:MAG: hypothetical protein WC061_10255, partial [Melioribacteraceae bacterium]
MNSKTKILSIAIVLTIFAQTYGQNKVGTTSFQFLKVMPGTRTTALGESTVSMIDGIESLFSNPAGILSI